MLKKFTPEGPDKYLNSSADLPLARFGHINQLVNAINTLETNSGGGIVESIAEGDNISVDNTDPTNPVVSVIDVVKTITGDSVISVDDSDPENITLTATIPPVTGFVPLAGTAGNPITGDIEMNGTATLKKVGTNSTNTLRIGSNNNILKTVQNTGTISSEFITTFSTVEGAKALIQATDNTGDITLFAIKASSSNHSIEIDSDSSNFSGIEYVNDFSSKYSSNSLISRKDAPQILTAGVAPVSTPNKIGDMYINTTGPEIYIATGITSSADWKKVF